MDIPSFETIIGGKRYTLPELFHNYANLELLAVESGYVVKTGKEEYLVQSSGMHRRVMHGGTMSPAEEVTSWSDLSQDNTSKSIIVDTENDSATIPKLPKEVKIMKIVHGKYENELTEKIVKKVPEAFADKEILTVEDLDAIIAASTGRDATSWTQFKASVIQKAEALEAEDNANEDSEGSEDPSNEGGEGDSQIDGEIKDETLNGSSLFNNSSSGGGRRGRRERTEAEKDAAKARRDEKLRERELRSMNLEGQLASANETLKDNADFVETVDCLKKLLTQPFGGVVAIDGIVTTMNTRIKSNIKNLVKAEDRVYHPNVVNPDKTKTGKSIEAKYAKGLFEVSLVESAPGTVLGALVKMPVNLTVEHLNSLTSMITATTIKNMAATTPKYTTVAVDKATFTMLLTILNVPAYHVTARNEKDTTRSYYISEPHQTDTELFWYSLKAINREGRVTKLACNGYIPLATYNTASLAQTDRKALTSLIFGKSLTKKSTYTNDTKFNQLTSESASLFTGGQDNLVYSKFADSMNVPSYESTKNNQTLVSMKLPATRMSEATDEKPSQAQFVKSRYTEATYQPSFASRMNPFKDVLGSFRRTSSTTRQNEQFKKTAYNLALARAATGAEIATSKIS